MAQFSEVHFKVKLYTQLSECVKVVGNIPQLGSWNPNQGLTLMTNQEFYPFWMSETPLRLKKGTKIEFKFAIFCANDFKRWENIPFSENRLYRVLYFKVVLECLEGSLPVMEKRVQQFLSNDSFSEAAQDFSVSDGSFSSHDFKSGHESPILPLKQENHQETKHEGALFESDVSPELHNVKELMKNIGSCRRRGSKCDANEHTTTLVKPIFIKDLKKGILKSPDEAVEPKQTQKSQLQAPQIQSLIEHIKNTDDVFSKIYEKLIAEKKNVKTKFPALVQSFDQHECLNDQSMKDVRVKKDVKFFVATYRLPFNIKYHPEADTKEERWEISIDTERYASILHFFGKEDLKDTVLVGCVGSDIPEENQIELEEILKKNHQAVPIFLTADVYEKYAGQYCKHLLFNAFYNLLDQATMINQEELIPSYRRVNQIFAEKIMILRKQGEARAVLIYDYPLLLVPEFIALSHPKQMIAFIFETAFPSIETFMLLEHQEELLKSILCCDLIFFKAHEHLKAFATLCSRALGLKCGSERGGYLFINYFRRKVSLQVTNQASEFLSVSKAVNQKAFFEAQENFQQKNLQQTIMVCATHFHPCEGIAQFLDAMLEFFMMNPLSGYKLILLQMRGSTMNEESAPSITEQKSSVFQKINEINQELSRKQVVSSIEVLDDCTQNESYAVLDLAAVLFCFATTLSSDLKVLEYLTIKKSVPAAVVLSKWMLSLKNLNCVCRVNPRNKKQVIQALLNVFAESKETQEILFNIDKILLQKCSVIERYEMLQEDLSKIIAIKESMKLLAFQGGGVVNLFACINQYQRLDFNHIGEQFVKAKSRVIIVNYENVLLNTLSYDRNLAWKEETKITRHILKEQIELLDRFARAVDKQFYVISSKNPEWLNCLYEELDSISVLAENGFLYKVRKESTWQQLYPVDWSFKTIVQKIMQSYVYRTEGSWIEKKESSICWNYEDLKTSVGDIQVQEMRNHLAEVLEVLDDVEICCGSSWIEVKPRGINKGIALELALARSGIKKAPADFVLCIGADSADEEMFAKLSEPSALVKEGILAENAEVFTVSVGRRPSHANYYLDNTCDVYNLFSKMVELLENKTAASPI